jgi:hypothetical protein
VTVLLTTLSVIATLALLWAGIKRLEGASLLKAILSVLDVVALGIALVQLGWFGLAVFVGANVVGFLLWGAVGAAYVDQQLSAGAALGNAPKAALRRVYKELERDRNLRGLGPRRRALLVRALAERCRSPEEIADMAPAIGVLWIIEEGDLETLADDIDKLIRRYDKPAAETMNVADTLTASAQRSASTVRQMIDALLSASSPNPAV